MNHSAFHEGAFHERSMGTMQHEQMVGNPPPKLGSGERFATLKKKIAARGDVRDAGAVAAAIGRKKYGSKKFAKLAAAGRKSAK
jgi:hypothetical protein